MKIGISGGTFDPIHVGHLMVAETIREKFELDKILFIPVGDPPHKNYKDITDKNIRLEMVKKAIEGNCYFEFSDIEVKRKGFTYAIDTLKELQKIYPEAQFYYIVGSDVVFDILTWKAYEEVFKICKFIVVLRSEHNIQDLNQRIKYLKDTYGALILINKMPGIEISSTWVRDTIKKGLSVKYFVPDCVGKFIIENRLYR
jgi:nicotinate-nucleotide adenylyltransferase